MSVRDGETRIEGGGRWRRPEFLAGAGVLLGSLAVYLITLAPTVVWGDSASFAIQVVRMQLGFGADSHPLFILLGRLFSLLPFEVAYSLNLLSAVVAALAVFNVYLIVLELTDHVLAAVTGAVSLLFSHAFWLHAVITEVYDLNAFFVTVVVLTLVKWRRTPERLALVYLAVFLFGLGLSNHLILALEGVGLLFFILATGPRTVLKPKVLALSALSFLCGSGLWIFLLVRKLVADKALSPAVHVATGGALRHAMGEVSVEVFQDAFLYLAYLFYQFPALGFALGVVGIWAMARRTRGTALFLLILIGVNLVFFLCFGPGRRRTTKYTFYISDYTLYSVFIGYGARELGAWLRRRNLPSIGWLAACVILAACLPVGLYSVTPWASKRVGIDLLNARTLPYRDNDDFFLRPSKRGYRGAARFAEEALRGASDQAVIVADYTPLSVLRYVQEIRRVRPDVVLVEPGQGTDSMLKKMSLAWEGGPDVYFAGLERGYYRLGRLEAEYEFVPEGVLYRVIKKGRGTGRD